MGVNYGVTPAFKDYLVATIPYSTADTIHSFNAGIEFLGGFERDISPTISAGAEYSYFLRSLYYTYSFAVFDYTIKNHQPYLFFNYNVSKTNIDFKAGLMAGYHFQEVESAVSASQTEKYSSSGPSVRLSFTVLPKFSKNVSLYANGFAFANFYSKLKNSSGVILAAQNGTNEADLSGYGVGVRLGLLFYIN